MSTQLVTDLTAVKSHLTPAAWAKGSLSLRPGRCCLVIALNSVTGGEPSRAAPARNALAKVIGTNDLMAWQDEPRRTHGDVIAAIDTAISTAGGTAS